MVMRQNDAVAETGAGAAVMTSGRFSAAPMAIGLGIANLARRLKPPRRRERPSAAELMQMSADDFEAFVHTAGLRTVSMLEPTSDRNVAD
jgi:hypothetical protein